MSVLQEQAVRMINGLSDDKVSFLIEIIQQLMPQKVYIDNEQALPDYEASAKIITKCASGELKGYIAFHSIPNLWYILRKIPETKRREWIKDVCSILRVVGTSHEEVLRAVQMKEFKDFEDCLQDRCAEGIGAEYIVTRNTGDFENSKVPAVSPEDLIMKMEN